MPWLIEVTDDGTDGFVWGSNPFGRVITSNHQILEQPAAYQFGKPGKSGNPTIPDAKDEFSFLRAEYEYGRAFYYLKRARKTLPARGKPQWYCDRFKRILEELEPGKHRFARIDLRMPDKVTPWPEPYWFWRCENFVEAIIPDIGDGDPWRSRGYFWVAYKSFEEERQVFGSSDGRPFYGEHRPVPLEKPVLNAAAIADSHAWRDTGLLKKHHVRLVFLSDHFVVRLKEANAVKGLALGPVATSDLSATRGQIEGGK